MRPAPRDVADRSLKLLWQHEPTALLRVAGSPDILSWQPERTEQVALRRPDGVLRVRDPCGEYVVHAEFESRPGPRLHPRVLDYNVTLHRTLPEHPPVRSIVFALRPPPAGFVPEVRVGRPGCPPHLVFVYELVDLSALDPAVLAEDPQLAPLTPLGLGFRSAAVHHLRRAAERIRLVASPQRENRMAVLNLLGRARGVTREEMDAIISEEEVCMAHSYEEILEIGYARGIEKGIEKGIQKGVRTGRVEATRNLLRLRLGQPGVLDDLLEGCAPEDLSWLDAEILRTRSPQRLRTRLLARLREPRAQAGTGPGRAPAPLS